MKSINAVELNEWKMSGKPHQLIDIRELYEVETCTIGGENIVMSEIFTHLDDIKKDIPVVIHCKSGKRSSAVVHALEQKTGMKNLYTLEGGILAWIEEVDPTMVKY